MSNVLRYRKGEDGRAGCDRSASSLNIRFSSANISVSGGTISITIDETGAPRWVRGMMAAVPHRLLLSCYNDAAAVKV